MKKEDIIKTIDEMIKSLRKYKSILLDLLMINENEEFANEQYNITIHQIYILQELKEKLKGE